MWLSTQIGSVPNIAVLEFDVLSSLSSGPEKDRIKT